MDAIDYLSPLKKHGLRTPMKLLVHAGVEGSMILLSKRRHDEP
jgi:hypothetical protein